MMKIKLSSKKNLLNMSLSSSLIFCLSLLSTASSSSNALNESSAVSSTLEQQNKSEQQIEMSIMHLDLDYIYDSDPKQLTLNIHHLIKRIHEVQPNTIFMQAFADPDANGSAHEVYFSNPHLPVRAELFKKVTEQIRTQTKVKIIYAWLPMWAWELPKDYQANYVKHANQSTKGYIRLSPFDPKNFIYVYEIYKALTDTVTVDGILYHDDITLNDFEDSSASAMRVYKLWGFKDAAQLLHHPQHPNQLKFAKAKTAYLDDLALQLSNKLKKTHPELKFARNSYAPVMLNPESEKWFAQSTVSTLQHYDYNAVMAMPYMEKAADPKQFYLDLIVKARQHDPALARTIFEIQTIDWNTQRKLSNEELLETIQLLKENGVQHIGYYPEDPYLPHPSSLIFKPKKPS
ncbi:poly-beta-1,6-N-acetyl-D-glucosamine N-deacetylase PgaB [Acinetobacter thermotolerans]|uniref:poly-beta-1,6-N-acetyl-D-glucosamine N-deacetylase PgaB n=1 Tax=Acinetobacter thermotolerans TaxID=3151487 RepID=UPI00325BAD45